MINWNISIGHVTIIHKIASRWLAAQEEPKPEAFMDVSMDLMACHLNGCPLDLAALLEAKDFDFFHDVNGIQANIDRETGELQNCFLPRYSAKP